MRRPIRYSLLALGIIFLGLSLPSTTYAHGFGDRYDLPVPLSFLLIGSGATVALSFVVIGLFVKGAPSVHSYWRHNLLDHLWFRVVLASRPFSLVAKLASVGLLVLVIATGLAGTEQAVDNLSPTLVWVIWWVGMGFISALVGNVWTLINPWKIVFQGAERVYSKVTGGDELSLHFNYPEWLGIWPAFLLFFAFAWLENVYDNAAAPRNLAVLVILYSLITWSGMLIYGKHQWLKRGEAFSAFFGFFARFSPTEVRVANRRLCGRCSLDCLDRDGECVDCYECYEDAEPQDRELNLRPYAVGLSRGEAISPSMMAFVLLALATVTFDGITETSTWLSFENAIYPLARFFSPNDFAFTGTLGLVLFSALFIGVYLLFSYLMNAASGRQKRFWDLARHFAFSLIPIALAYHLSHFLSLLAIQGQAIIPLASDPFGYGWDLFGTADYRIDISVVNAKFVWFLSVGAIVLGHIIAVYLAHTRALRTFPDHGSAQRSQYPMLALMVMYTITSLWIIAQPIVE